MKALCSFLEMDLNFTFFSYFLLASAVMHNHDFVRSSEQARWLYFAERKIIQAQLAKMSHFANLKICGSRFCSDFSV